MWPPGCRCSVATRRAALGDHGVQADVGRPVEHLSSSRSTDIDDDRQGAVGVRTVCDRIDLEFDRSRRTIRVARICDRDHVSRIGRCRAGERPRDEHREHRQEHCYERHLRRPVSHTHSSSPIRAGLAGAALRIAHAACWWHVLSHLMSSLPAGAGLTERPCRLAQYLVEARSTRYCRTPVSRTPDERQAEPGVSIRRVAYVSLHRSPLSWAAVPGRPGLPRRPSKCSQ